MNDILGPRMFAARDKDLCAGDLVSIVNDDDDDDDCFAVLPSETKFYEKKPKFSTLARGFALTCHRQLARLSSSSDRDRYRSVVR